MSETKTLHRNFWVWEFEKEERWLNEMAQEGWALQNAGFCTYTFEKTEPGQYIIRLAMLDSSPDFESFMESFNRFLIISLDVLICRYSPLFRAFPALFISEEPHKSFYYPLCFRSQK